MHLLLLPSWYFPFGSQAIAGRMFYHLASGLRENDIDARILYSNYAATESLIKKEEANVEEGVPTWRYSQMYPPKVNAFILQLWQKRCANDILNYIEKEGQPDLIQAHSYLAATVASLVQKKIQIPFVYTERLSVFMTDKIPEFHFPFIREVCETADHITAVSPGMARCLERFTHRRVQVIPNFYDPHVFYPAPKQKKFDAFTWLSIGEPAYIKGLDILFHAFARMKGLNRHESMQLILVDDIPRKAELLQLAKSLSIEKDVIWKGLVSQEELASIINRSHILVSASRIETFGKAIIEAQACGLPVVVTKTEGAQYTITNALQGEKAEIGDIDSLVRAMDQAMKHYPFYEPNKISTTVAARFSKEVVLREWISLYQSILS